MKNLQKSKVTEDDGKGCVGMVFIPGSGDTEMLCCRVGIDASGVAKRRGEKQCAC